MADIFSPQEILKIAMKVEENGQALYAGLEEKAAATKLKILWKYLKEQEEEHRQVFSAMIDAAGEYVIYEFGPGEYDTYLNAIASNYIFTQKLVEEKSKTLFDTDREAIDFAIFIEKESITAYTALRKYVVVKKQHILDKVIEEEKHHYVRLVALRDGLKKGD